MRNLLASYPIDFVWGLRSSVTGRITSAHIPAGNVNRISSHSYNLDPRTGVQGVKAPTAWTFTLRFQILSPQNAYRVSRARPPRQTPGTRLPSGDGQDSLSRSVIRAHLNAPGGRHEHLTFPRITDRLGAGVVLPVGDVQPGESLLIFVRLPSGLICRSSKPTSSVHRPRTKAIGPAGRPTRWHISDPYRPASSCRL